MLYDNYIEKYKIFKSGYKLPTVSFTFAIVL